MIEQPVYKNLRLLLALFCFSIFSQLSIAQQKKPFIIRTIDWGYKIVQGDSAHPRKRYLFAIPIIAYRPESKWIFGVSLAHIFRSGNKSPLTRPSTVRVNFSYSQMKQFSIKPFFEYFSADNRFNIKFNGQYTNFGEYYWGIGPNTTDNNKEFYTFKMLKANLKTSWRINNSTYVGIQYVFENMYNTAFETGSKLEYSGEHGATGYKTSAIGFCAYDDNRDNIYFPYSGHYVEISNFWASPVIGSDSEFANITLDYRQFLQLYKENILAFQTYFSANQGTIPFRMMGTLGSDMFMRGYYNGRLRDHNAFAFQTELRKTIWGPVGAAFFIGCGSVNKNASDIFSEIKPNYGFGLRVKAIPRERLNMRLDVGFGSGNIQAVYITLNEAF